MSPGEGHLPIIERLPPSHALTLKLTVHHEAGTEVHVELLLKLHETNGKEVKATDPSPARGRYMRTRSRQSNMTPVPSCVT